MEVVRYLAPLARNESANSAPEQLIEAAAADDIEMLEALLLAGADPNSLDFDHRTPLHLAVSNRSMKVTFDFPLYVLAEWWASGPQHHCGQQNTARSAVQVLKSLLSNPRTQLGPVDSQGHTPMWDAMAMGDHLIAAQLGAKGAPVQSDIAVEMCKAAAQNNVKFIELLLMHNVHVLARVRPLLTFPNCCMYNKTTRMLRMLGGGDRHVALLEPPRQADNTRSPEKIPEAT